MRTDSTRKKFTNVKIPRLNSSNDAPALCDYKSPVFIEGAKTRPQSVFDPPRAVLTDESGRILPANGLAEEPADHGGRPRRRWWRRRYAGSSVARLGRRRLRRRRRRHGGTRRSHFCGCTVRRSVTCSGRQCLRVRSHGFPTGSVPGWFWRRWRRRRRSGVPETRYLGRGTRYVYHYGTAPDEGRGSRESKRPAFGRRQREHDETQTD